MFRNFQFQGPQGLFSKLRDWPPRLFSFLKKAAQGLLLIPSLRLRQIPQILESLTKKDFLHLAAMLVIAALSAGILISRPEQTSGQTAYGGEYIEGLVGQPRFINPVLAASNSVDMDLSRIVYSQLLKFDSNLQLAPDLAESLPTVSSDQKTYTLKLKPNLKWQDGRPLLADDVVYTISAIQDQQFE